MRVVASEVSRGPLMEVPRDPARSGTPDGPNPGPDRLDAARVSALFDEYGPELFRFLLGMLRDSHQAQDALQATFIKTIERGHTASADSLRGWLFRVAAREAITLRRGRERRRRHEHSLAWLQRAIEPKHSNADDPLIRLEHIDAVRDALAELPPETLAIVRARIFEDKTFAQIAEDHQLPLGTVLTRMRRALRRLSGRLRNLIEDEPQ